MHVIYLLSAICLTVGHSSQTATQPPAPAVRVIKDVDYVGAADYPEGRDKLDLYLPEGRRNFPVIVSIYGGALTTGEKSGHAFVGRRFAAAGIGTAVINYRLSPSVSHPAHVEDAAAAFAWVRKHIGEYGGDPESVFVIGHSAGAYLAALLALDKRYLGAHKLTPQAIRGVVPVSAFYYVERVAPERPKTVWGIERSTWLEASPSRYVSKAAPPMLLLYADGDDPWRREQNEEMAKAMREARCRDVEVKQIANRDHRTIWAKMGEDEEVSKLIIAFVTRLTAKSRESSI
ncbi:MAG: alpha/beta hydrolase [Acidobacteriota bacterium]